MRSTKLLFAPLAVAIAVQVAFAKDHEDSPAQIVARVQDKLYHAQVYKHGDVQVSVENGVATLTGTVDCLGVKEDAERAARKVDDVTELVDNINVHAEDVTLEGVVANQLDRAKAETDARLAATYFNLTDNLRVESK